MRGLNLIGRGGEAEVKNGLREAYFVYSIKKKVFFFLNDQKILLTKTQATVTS